MKEIIEGLNLPKQILDKAEKLMSTLFGPSAKEIGELMADKIRYKRMVNQVSIFKKTADLLEKNNLEAKELKLKTLVPLIESSSLEEDEKLQDKWANLIANISSNPENGLEPKLVKTLSNLSALEAQVLDYIHEAFLRNLTKEYELKKDWKWMKLESEKDIRLNMVIIRFEGIQKKFNLETKFTQICIDNLDSLGLIKYEEPEIEIENNSGDPQFLENQKTGERKIDFDLDVNASVYQSDNFHLTTYGKYFIEQCKEVKNAM